MPPLLRSVATLACLLSLLSVFGVSVTSPPASATSTLLCQGYAGCSALDRSNAGYKAASGTMWWRMYAGHNCTNYVAYRMTKSGLPNARPWTGGGNASNWGGSNPRLTDSVPKVGAVAWWDANVRPAGSAGHVAYVERVVSAHEIVVSQDSWGGDFSWARIARAGGGWPSGFIHFNDVPLRNTARPSVAGTPKVGALLTASVGSWSQFGVRYAYQWRANGVDIANANGSSLRLRLAQQGKRVTLRVTASKLGYPTTAASSARTPAVAPGRITNTTKPTITGDAKVDSPLTASPGGWTPSPTALTYQWSADDVSIQGAVADTLVPGPELVGKALSVTVTASKAGYARVSATSDKTDPVTRGTFAVSAPATVIAPATATGRPKPGQTLRLDPGTFTPSGADVSVKWLRSGVPVRGMAGSTYNLTAADLGYRIAARVTLTKPGYTKLITKSRATRRVKSVPKLRVFTTPGQGRLRLSVTVTAAGVKSAPGTVLVRSRGEVVRALTLRKGAAATTINGLPKGLESFKIRYVASERVSATALTRNVRIG